MEQPTIERKTIKGAVKSRETKRISANPKAPWCVELIIEVDGKNLTYKTKPDFDVQVTELIVDDVEQKDVVIFHLEKDKYWNIVKSEISQKLSSLDKFSGRGSSAAEPKSPVSSGSEGSSPSPAAEEVDIPDAETLMEGAIMASKAMIKKHFPESNPEYLVAEVVKAACSMYDYEAEQHLQKLKIRAWSK